MKPGISSSGKGGGASSSPTKALSTFGGGRKLPGLDPSQDARPGISGHQDAEGAVGVRSGRGHDAVGHLFLDQEGGARDPGVVGQESLQDGGRHVVGEVAGHQSRRGKALPGDLQGISHYQSEARIRKAPPQMGCPIEVQLPAESPGPRPPAARR